MVNGAVQKSTENGPETAIAHALDETKRRTETGF